MTRILGLLVLIFACWGNLQAQGTKFGIKAGLNFSTLSGPAEIKVDEQNQESNRFAPGFHLGPVFNYEFTDKVGIQVELLYSQKGSKYRFFSDSAFYHPFFAPEIASSSLNEEPDIWASGKKEELVNINTGYMLIPASLFYNVTPNFRIGAGLEFGVLLHATGTGEVKMRDAVIRSGTNEGITVDDFSVLVDHKYSKDKAGLPDYAVNEGREITEDNGNDEDEPRSLVDPLYVQLSQKAYDFEAEGSKERMFSPIDLNANLDLAYVFNSGLYFNIRGSYGLLDATNNKLDYSKLSLTDPENGDLSRVRRSDKDVNLSIQVSVGFNF